MHTYNSLMEDIKALGIMPCDTIKIHSSLKSVGEIDGGGETLLDVFCDYLMEDGLLVLPSHTWGNIKEYDYLYDPVETPSNLGVLPNLFRKRKNVYRSLHPTHSVCAFGKEAESFVNCRLPQTTPCPRRGCYGKLYDMSAKILLLGVTLTSNTFFHGIEEWEHKKVKVLTDDMLPTKIKLTTGEIIDAPIHNFLRTTSLQFDKAMGLVLAEESTKTGKIGNADCILIDCKKIYPIIKKLFEEQPEIFIK